MFLIKKVISAFLMPLSLCTVIIVSGILLHIFGGRKRLARMLIVLGLSLFVCFSFSPIPDCLISPLENRYPPLADPETHDHVKWVVVLGGGHVPDPRLSANNQLLAPTLNRLIEGIRIHRMLPGSKLILSGGGYGTSQAETMARAAVSLGIDRADLVLEDQSLDTKDEAMLLKGVVRSHPFILVTSAAHMPRSMALFRKLGMAPIPAPADYLVKKADREKLRLSTFLPGSGNLQKAESALHEYLGLAWGWLRGQI